MPIRDWPEAIRPRERLIRDGPPALSDAQLLALVIGSGTKRRSAVAMAEALLHSIGGIGGLARADPTKFRAATGWEPKIPFDQTLRDVLDYWRERVAAEGGRPARAGV